MVKSMNAKTARPVILIAGIAFMITIVLGVAELGSFGTLRFVVMPRDPSLVYVPPDIDPSDYDRYRALQRITSVQE